MERIPDGSAYVRADRVTEPYPRTEADDVRFLKAFDIEVFARPSVAVAIVWLSKDVMP